MKARNLILHLFTVFTLATLGTAWGQSLDPTDPNAQISESTGMFGITQNKSSLVTLIFAQTLTLRFADTL